MAIDSTKPQGSSAIASIPRVGRIVQTQIVVSATGVVTPVTLNTPNNAFYVLDAPVPLVIRTGISPQQAYSVQTGESFPQQIQQVIIVGIVSSVLNITYTVKLWIGPDSHIGFIDHRAMPVPNSTVSLSQGAPTITTTLTGNAVTSVAMSSTIAAGRTSAPNAEFYTELMVGNLDSTNTVYMASKPALLLTDIQGIAPLFASQIYRLPIPYGIDPYFGGTVSFYNPNASSVVISVAGITTCAGYGLEATP